MIKAIVTRYKYLEALQGYGGVEEEPIRDFPDTTALLQWIVSNYGEANPSLGGCVDPQEKKSTALRRILESGATTLSFNHVYQGQTEAVNIITWEDVPV